MSLFSINFVEEADVILRIVKKTKKSLPPETKTCVLLCGGLYFGESCRDDR